MQKLRSALITIARFHDLFDATAPHRRGESKSGCVFCSFAIVDFLQKIGVDAEAIPVILLAVTEAPNEKPIRQSCGYNPDVPSNHWAGHMVVTTGGYLIDATHHSISAPKWLGLPPVLSLPVGVAMPQTSGHATLAVAQFKHLDEQFTLAWLANPGNVDWQNGSDSHPHKLRREMTEALIAHYKMSV